MKTQRRELLAALTAAAGAALLPIPLAAGQDASATTPAGTPRETVAGIGGFFFRAHDPEALGRWYREHLGIALTPEKIDDPVWTQEAGETLFSPFPETTKYFGDPSRQWMMNFRVRNLDRLAAQLEAAGIAVKVDRTHYPNGRFARLHDPEGNPIELWQPLHAAK